ncbi:MAG: hypothetical protein ABII76_17730 [Pseudomonadota bacterium]
MVEKYASEEQSCEARTELRNAIMIAFCNVLHASHLPPMTVMELAAEALGSIYHEVADAHCGEHACLCGWKPAPDTDIGTLRAAVAAAAKTQPVPDLRELEVAGRA